MHKTRKSEMRTVMERGIYDRYPVKHQVVQGEEKKYTKGGMHQERERKHGKQNEVEIFLSRAQK